MLSFEAWYSSNSFVTIPGVQCSMSLESFSVVLMLLQKCWSSFLQYWYCSMSLESISRSNVAIPNYLKQFWHSSCYSSSLELVLGVLLQFLVSWKLIRKFLMLFLESWNSSMCLVAVPWVLKHFWVSWSSGYSKEGKSTVGINLAMSM